jgi:hypothetical protein
LEDETSREDSFEVSSGMEIGNALPRVPSAPDIAGPDLDLYLAIERVQHYREPDIVFCGRVNGESIGTVSIIDVMLVIAKSVDALQHCSQNCAKFQERAISIAASQWLACRVIHSSLPICLQVDGSTAWRLFAAGQVSQFGGSLMYGCFPCAVRVMSAENGKEGGGVVVAGKERIG